MQSSSITDKRNSPRKVCYSEVTATNTEGNSRKLLSVNCSNSGIGLVSFTPIKVGEVFELEFSLKEHSVDVKYKVTAEVVHRHNVSEIYALGLRFDKELDLPGQTLAS